MIIGPKTKITALIKSYPFLKEFLVGYNLKFQLLASSIALKTVGRIATLNKIANIGDISVTTLMKDLAAEIKKQTGDVVEIQADEGDDGDAERLATMKAILKELHGGKDLDELKGTYGEFLKEIDPEEIVSLEQQLVKEGIAPEEIQKLCDVHVELFKDALESKDEAQAPPGHPVYTYMEENRAILARSEKLDGLIRELAKDPSDETFGRLREKLESGFGELSKIEIHYQRKENQLFPVIEKHGMTAPPKVMWGVHDQIRAQLKSIRGALQSGKAADVAAKWRELTVAVTEMVYKENKILFPMALETLKHEDWLAIRKGDDDIGYVFVEPAAVWPEKSGEDAEKSRKMPGGMLSLDTGEVSADQVNLMLKHLPVDITYVDENNEVRYYSEGKERIFPRSPGIIGRKVQNCHPPKSLDTVNKIVGAFRAGTKDSADFWLNLGGRLIYIRYFAVRDSDGMYKGVVEVSQDITDIQKIEGERRLLSWEGSDD